MTEKQITPLRVLVVEDQDDTAQSTAELLTLCGHIVRVVSDGSAALIAAGEAVPDVVLLDIGLPGMDGWEVARRLRDQAVGKQPFIVAVTGYGSESDRWQSAGSGIDMHLVKPAEPAALEKLLAWVRDCLDR